MVVDAGNKLVTFTLTSAYNGNNGSWNYNGFYNGSANLVVPQGWNVNLKFVNPPRVKVAIPINSYLFL